jgi:hypothetical protein
MSASGKSSRRAYERLRGELNIGALNSPAFLEGQWDRRSSLIRVHRQGGHADRSLSDCPECQAKDDHDEDKQGHLTDRSERESQ